MCVMGLTPGDDDTATQPRRQPMHPTTNQSCPYCCISLIFISFRIVSFLKEDFISFHPKL
jgi:hypothetical protein